MELLHTSLEAIVKNGGGGGSQLKGTVSSHCLPKTVPLSSLRTIYSNWGHLGTPLFVGTRERNLVISASTAAAKRKRNCYEKSEPSQAAQDATCEKMCKIKGTPHELAEARSVVNALLQIQGTCGEPALQSLTVERREMDAGSVGTEKTDTLVVAARMHAGVAVSLHALKHALGSGWKNGVLTTDNNVDSMRIAFPELSEEGKVAEEAGNVSWVAVFALDAPPTPSLVEPLAD